ncbi:glycosyltransferase family 4 protein [Acidithiobacillus ferrooxidans]|uniref:Glycosyl transferase, group 1 family protein n=3 Tax=Acidithiobacillus TaxID=119977 RepID=B7J9F9_ACIF2|nr:glycosyltransferase family 4 protein [Acidithiobacillus ferrooxidans]ACK80565.1 glycosyl transferase, group 1 family protein [Acidithiobacillus ferrooxidans ATCC 23270]
MDRLRTLQLGMNAFSEYPGGLSRVHFELMRHLPDVGVECVGLVAGSAAVAEQSGGQVRAFAPANAPLWQRWQGVRREMATMTANFRPQLVVSHFAFYTYPVLRQIKVPLVVHFQGPWADEGAVEGGRGAARIIKRSIETAVYRRARRLICLSQAFATLLVERYGVDPARVRIVPGGVDAGRFEGVPDPAVARERLGWPQDRPIVFAVRRLVRRMGLEDLIEAMVEVRRRVPDVLLLIGGRGPLQGELTARIEHLGLTDHVRLLGYLSDEALLLAYRAADITVVPTVALEGFGLIAAESLAAGTPTLVTPVGGLPEVVRDLSANLVLPSTGPRALTEGLSAALRGDMALPDTDACRAFARERYDWPNIAIQVRAVYEEALQND